MSKQQFVTVEEFGGHVRNMNQLQQQVVDLLSESAASTAALQQQAVHTQTSITKLERILTDGNGQPSVLQQLVRLQTELTVVSGGQRDQAAKLDLMAAAAKDDRRVRLTAIVSVICAGISAIALIISVLVKAK